METCIRHNIIGVRLYVYMVPTQQTTTNEQVYVCILFCFLAALYTALPTHHMSLLDKT